jgi:guanosine-3',5'-bis(diphosphate) 3'-pyrophosphohydrolase
MASSDNDEKKISLKSLIYITKAIDFAIRRHAGQTRKGDGSPYITHPLHVMRILMEFGITDKHILAAAVLHDVIEDTTDPTSEDYPAFVEEIESKFSAKTLKMVLEVTDDKTLSKFERKVIQLKNASSKSDGAKLIKIADKFSNCADLHTSPPKSWSQEMIEGYIVWSYLVTKECKGVNNIADILIYNFFCSFVLPIINDRYLPHEFDSPEKIDHCLQLMLYDYHDAILAEENAKKD